MQNNQQIDPEFLKGDHTHPGFPKWLYILVLLSFGLGLFFFMSLESPFSTINVPSVMDRDNISNINRPGNIVTPMDSDKCPTICPAHYQPVCGSDGQTYSNMCRLSSEACLIKPKILTVTHHGECDTQRINIPDNNNNNNDHNYNTQSQSESTVKILPRRPAYRGSSPQRPGSRRGSGIIVDYPQQGIDID